MRLYLPLGVRQFEPICADPVSDETISMTFLLHDKSSEHFAMYFVK